MRFFNPTDNFLKSLDKLEYGQFELVTPDGKSRVFGGKNPGPSGNLVLKEWKVLTNLLTKGDTGFAEDYKKGLWDTNNLQGLLSLALANDNVIKPNQMRSKMTQIFTKLLYMMRKNSIVGSRKNIHAHYDIGNSFYKLWLDDTMSYSSALFKDSNEDLAQAQNNKYDRIIESLDKNSGSLLEVGCGWGGFVDRAQQKGDFGIKGLTISKEQHSFAQDRVGKASNIALEDYRIQNGKYDHIVSIEMFEAVGEQYWPVYFAKIKDLLAQKGRAVIQTITIRDDLFEEYRKNGDVIRDYFFPGGMLPSPSQFEFHAKKAGLKCGNRFDFGKDYAKTLELWLHNFDHKKSDVTALGFDHGFVRLWRFYLAACIAGFSTNTTNVMQIELMHA